ncbi:hypothetical protein NBO_6g0040 [Nosema bombycis CQ1]|uniref:Uncharacterized protein n=1 Tax=Nosema bombycis (strain CQ1 / CVCC 102059) TaxID=578461 RepID=R0MQX8_NOSB1|nr:hypothetical protein NBO_6g0040 [Nosema bombycis CQ1]|eukprot:EOB15288.1 hypothetical protein NBO_6g0040 [Nosema bombycis CQ1]
MFFILLLTLRISTFSSDFQKNTVEIPNPTNPDDLKYRLLNKVNDSFYKHEKEPKQEPKKGPKKEPKDNFKIDKSLKDLFTNLGPTSKKKIKSVNDNLFYNPSPKKISGLKPFRSENYHYNKKHVPYNKENPFSSSNGFNDIDFY